MRFFNRGGKDRPITPKQVRDVSDDENPVTFATGLDDEERSKELEEFGEDIKNNYTAENQSEAASGESNFEQEILDEVNEIALNRDLTAADKTIKIFNIYNEYEKTLSLATKVKIINTLDILDSKIKEEKTHDKYNDKINMLKERVTKYQKGSATTQSVAQGMTKKSNKTEPAEDWAEVASLLLLEAESQ